MSTVWLVGMMGAGKTAVGRALSERLGLAFIDTDQAIQAASGHTIPELWERDGESSFRDLEEQEIRSVAGSEAVVATGGGVVLRPANIVRMRESGPVIWLNAPVSVLALRVGSGSTRPLLDGQDAETRLSTIFDARRALYETAATLVVDTADATIDEVVSEVERWIRS